MLSGNGSSSRRPSLHTTVPLPSFYDQYSDSRTHGYQGPNRHVRLTHASSFGGGSIAKSEDDTRCVVAGKESLRILRISDPAVTPSPQVEHRFVKGHGGHRIDSSRNIWTGSGLKIDSAATDVVWGRGAFNHKILTSARNGELILWDLNKSGSSKYERRTRDHVRSIHCLAYSIVSQNYCTTGSADGDLRVWDIRDLSKSIMRIHHPTSIRAVALSPIPSKALQAITGLDNGSIYRWDLRMGQRGQLDRVPVAHAGPILSLDWAPPSTTTSKTDNIPGTTSNAWMRTTGILDELSGIASGAGAADSWSGSSETDDGRMGWLASGGLDRTVKVWNLTTSAAESHISRTPAYTLHTSFPVRRAVWRPSYECELAIVSNVEFGISSVGNTNDSSSSPPAVGSPYVGTSTLLSDEATAERLPGSTIGITTPVRGQLGDPVEVWDVRRGYIAKWTVRGSAAEGGVTDILFADSHALWAQHCSGSFSQFDLRQTSKPLDAIPRTAMTWNVIGSLAFATDKPRRWEIPFDDTKPERRQSFQDRRLKHKALGDRPYIPASQTLGTFSSGELVEDVEVFVKLAQGYKFDGNDRAGLCAHNARVAIDVEKDSAAQAWFLLGALLMDIVPPPSTRVQTPALSPLPLVSPHLPHSTSAPAAIPTTSSSRQGSAGIITSPHLNRSVSVDAKSRGLGLNSPVPGTASRHSPDRGSTGFLSPQRTTPTSSSAPSPHKKSINLPPLPASIFARRASSAGLVSHSPTSIPARPRLLSGYSRPKPSFSTSTPSLYSVSMQSESPSELSLKVAGPSLRHVGDGALDDSDDEEDGSGHSATKLSDPETDPGENTAGFDDNWASSSIQSLRSDAAGASTADNSLPPARYFYPARPSSTPLHIHPTPSPLSRVAGQQTWDEDEDERGDDDDDDSPSPASSSESESDYSPNENTSSRRSSKSKSSRRGPRSNKTRSRSSTVASLAGDAHFPTQANLLALRVPKLTKQESHSSIRTVTAVSSPHPDNESQKGFMHGLTRDDTIRDLASHNASVSHDDALSYKQPSSFRQAHKRVRSSLSTEFFIDRDVITPSAVSNDEDVPEVGTPPTMYEEEQAKHLESRMRDAGWDALRETFEIYADEGNVQMCTMLALVASKELKISRSRLLRFLEAYIDILVRLRLHASAAYIRKNAPADEIRNMTGLETTVYTSCGRCRKPLIVPSSSGPALTTTPTHAAVQKGVKTVIIQKPRGNYAFCNACKEATTKCSICRLPVRSLLFKCPVCMHGGHQACYQTYYSRRPMLPIPKHQAPSHSKPTGSFTPSKSPHMNASSSPGSQPATRERRMSRSGEPGSADDSIDGSIPIEGQSDAAVGSQSESILGHPCAAGCGHFCWAANEALYTRTDL
ncbi:hypothetical protein BXZ70DRAFT_912770 [Cristinia sonorae]|uniref:WD repeat protein n=1 Tax=Cristinia sonorae TaxID=1940300 RepID=A0A8K0UY55_9AGAR|nr:hypothetical protein BXZ70DRAFT_912770 [Cristinia sonorae]